MAASAPVSTNVAAAVSPVFASTPVVTPAAVTTTAVAPIVAPVPHVASIALAFVDTAPTVGNVAVAPLVAATVARTTSSVAAPLYAAVPPNAPSNAILPPAHLIKAPHGYHIPATNADGPFYVVARGRNLGIFSGWLVFCFWTSSTSLLICLTQGDRLSFSYWGQSRCVLTCSQCCRGTREDECGQERSVCFVFDLNIVQRHFPHTLPSSLLRCM